ncbi:MAG: hypothetical protein PHI97_31520 [Desulfobulbus sp.]|nr:hypothetical protein [Desulfobulbus sp.]
MPETKLCIQTSHNPTCGSSVEFCPKCLNLLSFSGMQQTDRGFQLVYDCPECESSFTYAPVTQMQLFEVLRDTTEPQIFCGINPLIDHISEIDNVSKSHLINELQLLRRALDRLRHERQFLDESDIDSFLDRLQG